MLHVFCPMFLQESTFCLYTYDMLYTYDPFIYSLCRLKQTFFFYCVFIFVCLFWLFDLFYLFIYFKAGAMFKIALKKGTKSSVFSQCVFAGRTGYAFCSPFVYYKVE